MSSETGFKRCPRCGQYMDWHIDYLAEQTFMWLDCPFCGYTETSNVYTSNTTVSFKNDLHYTSNRGGEDD